MGMLRKVLAGLMVGLGKGIEDKAKIDAQAARDELLMRREVALKQLGHQNQLVEQNNASRLRREEASHTATEQRVTNVQETKLQSGAQAERDHRTQGHEVRMAKLRADLEARNDRFARELQARIASGEIVDTRQNENGEWIGITKTGSTKPLGFRSNLPESADGVASSSDGGALRTPGSASAAPTKPEWTQADDNQFRTRYIKATRDTAPGLFRGDKKIPLNEALRMARGY